MREPRPRHRINEYNLNTTNQLTNKNRQDIWKLKHLNCLKNCRDYFKHTSSNDGKCCDATDLDQFVVHNILDVWQFAT